MKRVCSSLQLIRSNEDTETEKKGSAGVVALPLQILHRSYQSIRMSELLRH